MANVWSTSGEPDFIYGFGSANPMGHETIKHSTAQLRNPLKNLGDLKLKPLRRIGVCRICLTRWAHDIENNIPNLFESMKSNM